MEGWKIFGLVCGFSVGKALVHDAIRETALLALLRRRAQPGELNELP